MHVVNSEAADSMARQGLQVVAVDGVDSGELEGLDKSKFVRPCDRVINAFLMHYSTLKPTES